MHDMPFVNSALSVVAIGFRRRHEGDWVGAVITPWFPQSLCSPVADTVVDLASGDRVRIQFPLANSNSSPTTTPAAIFRPTSIAPVCASQSVCYACGGIGGGRGGPQRRCLPLRRRRSPKRLQCLCRTLLWQRMQNRFRRRAFSVARRTSPHSPSGWACRI
ncbi:MAG: [NiFe]-hydrogenase assembly chaperone HybE [Betaproteobacteria bacterium]|nr:[NiFe]-hydrogenase assembly chaperone HybE [Betaproteobacteria bacterium]